MCEAFVDREFVITKARGKGEGHIEVDSENLRSRDSAFVMEHRLFKTSNLLKSERLLWPHRPTAKAAFLASVR